jgi:hypothetical protein
MYVLLPCLCQEGKRLKYRWGIVVRAYRFSFLGSRDWEDGDSRPAQAKS